MLAIVEDRSVHIAHEDEFTIFVDRNVHLPSLICFADIALVVVGLRETSVTVSAAVVFRPAPPPLTPRLPHAAVSRVPVYSPIDFSLPLFTAIFKAHGGMDSFFGEEAQRWLHETKQGVQLQDTVHGYRLSVNVFAVESKVEISSQTGVCLRIINIRGSSVTTSRT